MKKIFIVDDDRHLLTYLEKYLREAGYEVLTTISGLSAVELLAEQTADLIFIDYFLPHFNADRLCQIIRKMEHLKTAYLVIMSAAARELEIDLTSIKANALIAKGTFKETAKHFISAIKDAETPLVAESREKVMGLESVYPRQMTKELLVQNRHLQAVLNSISEGIVEIHRGRVVYVNPTSEQLLGKPQDEMLAAYFSDLFDECYRSRIESLIQSGVKNRSNSEQNQTIQLDRKILWMKRLPLECDDDTIILLVTDVTDRIRAENAIQKHQQHLEALVEKRTYALMSANEKLRQAQKMEAVGIVAGGVAHDLNNILSGIVSYPELLLLDLPEVSSLRKPILTIKKSGEKAAAIVQDLLTLARRGVVIDEILNLNTIVSEYLGSPEYSKMKSYHSDVLLETILDKDLLNIKGSSVHLSKALMNIISNAAEAMPKGGKILISTENQYVDREIKGYETIIQGEYVILMVTDTGIGISKEDMERVFEPFYTKKMMGRSGTGLGMAVVWGTVKDHNGFIDIHSKEGKGTIFKLYFPATRQALAKDKSQIMMESYMGKKESILIVDDAEEQRQIASDILTKLGYLVSSVKSGEEAVDYFTENSADLIVLDMVMDPGIDGLETYKRILNISAGQKAIVASGFSKTERIRETQKLGAGQYIKKPYTLEKIGIAVRTELDK